MFKYLLFGLVFVSSFSHSKAGIIVGEIKHVRIHDKTVHTSNWAPPIFWFSLVGVGTAGTCKISAGDTLFIMDTEQAYSLVLAAFMGGKQVSLRYDDTVISGNGYCKATYLTIGNPPPSH